MNGIGYAAALVLAAVFARAGVAKLTRRDGTVRAFGALGLPPVFAVAVPVVELVLAAGLVLVPGWAATGALALLAAFSVFVIRAVGAGVNSGCGCFGSAGDDPVSWADVVRNGFLAVGALVALTASGPEVPSAGAVAVTAAGVALAVGVVGAVHRP